MSQQPRFTTPDTKSNFAAYGVGDESGLLGASPSRSALGNLSRLFGALALVTTTFGFAGCDGGVPQTQESELVIPDVEIAKNASAVSRPLENGESESEEGEQTECAEFLPVEETYDEETGDFRYEYVCADDGGDIERVITAGNDDGAGNGAYTSKYTMRDGDEEIWTVEYTLLEDGATQETIGSSSNGESYVSQRTYLADGSSIAEETYNYTEATYILSGTYDAEGRFSGEYVVDLVSTPDVNPDYTITHTENDDGSFTQIYDGIENGWNAHYTYSVAADGSVDYAFSSDNPDTAVSPDYEGAYIYEADLSGTGGYIQTYEDGSLLSVEDVFDADGSLIETWIFDDAATPQDVDQEGTMNYAADGTATGTVTTFVEGGESQTCTIVINSSGTTVTVCD